MYHLWRKYPTIPFSRYACTLEADSEAEAGFRVTDHDPHVADPGFMHALSQHMQRPFPVDHKVDTEGGHIDATEWRHAGEPGHFETGVRLFPLAHLDARGRP